jgi:hypothetical protein
MRSIPAFRSPFRVLGGSGPGTAMFLGALRSGESVLSEVGGQKMVGTLTASWTATADLGYRDRLADVPP